MLDLFCLLKSIQFSIHSINQSIKFDDDDEFQLIVTTNKSTNNPSHCHSLACFNFHLLQNRNQIKLARGQSQSIQSFLIHLNQFNVTINQIKSKSNETNSFFLSLISLIIIESIKLFLSNSSIFNVSLLSINQSTNNQSNHTLSTHSQIKINSQINQSINQINE